MSQRIITDSQFEGIRKYIGPLSMTEINTRLRDVDDVPTLPHIVERILSLTSNANTKVNQLSKIISHDVSMSTKLLKIANSAYYAPLCDVKTIDNAIMMLGFNEVKHICAATALIKQFPKFGEELTVSIADFWKHSLANGMISRQITKELERTDGEELFFAGLLHDFGKIVIFNCFPKHFTIITALAATAGYKFYEIENELLGVDHAYCGHVVSEKWKIPVDIREIILSHHNIPINAGEEFPIVDCAIIHLADHLAHKIFETPFIPEISEQVWLHLPETLKENMDEIWGQRENILEIIDEFF